MIFVDSGAWFAKFAQDDPDHLRVEDWFAANQEPLVTTDYCVDETLTLLVARRRPGASLLAGRQFFEQSIARLHFVTPDQIHRAWILFQQRASAGWSFTDCTSKIVIDDLELAGAVAWMIIFARSATSSFCRDAEQTNVSLEVEISRNSSPTNVTLW